MKEQDRILELGEERFFNEGFHKIKMDDIATELRMSKKTIYKIFPSKEGLAHAIAKRFMGKMKEMIVPALGSDKNAIEKLNDLIAILAKTSEKINPQTFNEIKRYFPDIWNEVDKFRTEMMFGNITKVIDQGKKEGLFLDYPTSIIMNMLVSSVRSVVNPEFILHNNFSLIEAARTAFNILIGGIVTEKGKKILVKKRIKMKTTKMIVIFAFLFLIVGCSNNDNNTFIEATGTIESTNVIVSSRNTGEIKSILFTEGDRVNTGDTILIIDSETLQYQLDQALAGEQIAQAQLNLMLKGARSEDINQAEEMMKQSEVNFNTAKNDFERYKKLWESKSISQKQFEDMTSRYEVALAQYNSAKENYQKVKKIFRLEEIEQAKGNVKKAKASADLLKKNIRDSYVTTPLTGFIVKKFIEVGETVTPMSSLFKVSNLSTVELVIYVSEVELGKIKLGQKAEVTIDTYPDRKYEGTVTYISPEAEFTPKNVQTKDERTKLVFAVKLQVSNKDFDLKSGMPADATITTKL